MSFIFVTVMVKLNFQQPLLHFSMSPFRNHYALVLLNIFVDEKLFSGFLMNIKNNKCRLYINKIIYIINTQHFVLVYYVLLTTYTHRSY